MNLALCLIPMIVYLPLVNALWERIFNRFHKYTKTNLTGAVLCKSGNPATSGLVQLFDDDFWKDELIGSQDFSKSINGKFELSGKSADWKFLNPSPDIYMKFSDVCGLNCGKIILGEYPTADDGSVDLELGIIDFADPEYYGMNEC